MSTPTSSTANVLYGLTILPTRQVTMQKPIRRFCYAASHEIPISCTVFFWLSTGVSRFGHGICCIGLYFHSLFYYGVATSAFGGPFQQSVRAYLYCRPLYL
jgi:hypothetical protein